MTKDKTPKSGKLGKRTEQPHSKDGWFPGRVDPKPKREAGGGEDRALGRGGRRRGNKK